MQLLRKIFSKVFSKEGYFPHLFAAITVCSLILAANETGKANLLAEQMELLEKQNGLLKEQLTTTTRLVQAEKELCRQSKAEINSIVSSEKLNEPAHPPIIYKTIPPPTDAQSELDNCPSNMIKSKGICVQIPVN